MCNVKLLLACLVLLISGCAHLSDGNRVTPPSSDNKNIAPLRVPPGMAISFNTLYPIPQKNYPTSTKTVDITPPSLQMSQNAGSGWFSWY